MGLFSFNDTSLNSDMALAPKHGDGKLYRMIQLAAITVIVITVALIILQVPFYLIKINSTANGIICSIGVIGVGGFVALPWVRVFESFKDKRYKITALVFIGVVGVCVILWIVCVWMIVGLVGSDNANKLLVDLLNSLNVIRVSIIVSLQFIIASYIAKNIIKYGKSLLPYQVLAGASQLYIDFYVCLVLTAVTITPSFDIEFSKTAYLLENMWTLALLVIFILIAIFPNMVFSRVDKRRLLEAKAAAAAELGKPQAAQGNNDSTDAVENNANNTADISTVDEKLNKIKELLDKGLITQEEYDKKREEILNIF